LVTGLLACRETTVHAASDEHTNDKAGDQDDRHEQDEPEERGHQSACSLSLRAGGSLSLRAGSSPSASVSRKAVPTGASAGFLTIAESARRRTIA
jgi:hypothetical protein